MHSFLFLFSFSQSEDFISIANYSMSDTLSHQGTLSIFYLSSLSLLFLSLEAIEIRLDRLKRFMRFKLLFVILFIASNLVILPLYYRSEKQDFRGLVNYLKGQLHEGDKIFVSTTGYIPGMLHYFGTHPEGRHHFTLFQKDSEGKVEHYKSFIYRNIKFTIHYSKTCCNQYISDGNRLWIIVGKWTAKKLKEESPCVLKGYFDGSFLNFSRFPADVSMYLFSGTQNHRKKKGLICRLNENLWCSVMGYG